jgi:hypothetical protein
MLLQALLDPLPEIGLIDQLIHLCCSTCPSASDNLFGIIPPGTGMTIKTLAFG